MQKKITGLIIMDGFGEREEIQGNAIKLSGTPEINKLKNAYPNTVISASGLDVGLPEGQMGNSEVGHLNIGAGRVVYQELTRINKDIEEGGFFKNEEFLGAIKNVKAHGSKLHLMGLLSNGGVHSHINHLYALLRLAAMNGVKAYVHCFTDGRDVSPDSGIEFVQQLDKELKETGSGDIASVMGRYYAMDRDKRYDRVEKAYNALVKGEGAEAASAYDAVFSSYKKGVTDEFIIPTVIKKNGESTATISKDDSVIFFNFRPDRAREITSALTQRDFDGFEVESIPLYYVCMTEYDEMFTGVHVAYKPESLKNTFGEYISKLGLKQFRIAETEKYAHVTFFFNGGAEKPYEGEDRLLIQSPKVATYDLKPEMSAYEVADEAVKHIESGKYDVIIMNFANSDMVGHTGIIEAAVKAVNAVDICVAKVVSAILKSGGEAIVTADHGNSEKMLSDDGGPFTAHTSDKVPLILASERLKHARLKREGRLADIAPTMLHMMGIPIPKEMTGISLIENEN